MLITLSHNKTIHSKIQLFAICIDSPLTWALFSNSMICIIFASTLQYKMSVLLAGYLKHFFTCLCFLNTLLLKVLVLSAVVGILHECSDNSLMTFCSNKFSGSDVSSILFWSESVLIQYVLSVASFSLSAGISVALREKYFFLYLSEIHSPHILYPDRL